MAGASTVLIVVCLIVGILLFFAPLGIWSACGRIEKQLKKTNEHLEHHKKLLSGIVKQ